MSAERNKAASDLLAFYRDAGVDALVGDAPVDRLAAEAGDERAHARAAGPVVPPRPPPSSPEQEAPERGQRSEVWGQPPTRPGAATPSVAVGTGDAPSPAAPDAAVMAARDAARAARSLDELAAILARFEGCALKVGANRLVFADGNPKAAAMFVGEAPGADEDRVGRPFVGRSGKLLDRMLAAIGLDRTSAYIANIIPWRPPGNRTPTPVETQICLPFIQRQIELADPDILVCLGGPAAQTLLGVKEGIMRTRGRWFPYRTGAREIRAIATLHPAYLLRQPLAKRLAWRDFLAIKAALAATAE